MDEIHRLYEPEHPGIAERVLFKAARSLKNQRRRARLRTTPAASLGIEHLSTLELCEIIPRSQIKSIWDVGANRGTWSVLARSVFPMAEIQAFEPMASMFDLLVARSPKDARCHRLALSNETRAGHLHIMSSLDSSSLLSPGTALGQLYGIEEQGTEEIKIIRADEFITETGSKIPELVKLDVQGCELQVLEGFGKYLPQISYIVTEISFLSQYEGQPIAGSMVSWFDQHEFRLIALSDSCGLGRPLIETDALFARL